ncbi:non-homologous end-joining DNA ligase [Streptomyces sp. SL13]|uniref:Non-homologous end-joining DNA ligase n=1 Tax=Streptantibioticus silvisoli TaxID=2705255 RepID=A0AA90H0X3_9ACTN|nr:non-homologous end-joining DNA ligase [Streptantibioticus silvisoli]MDI5971988.1 non-homologous end-joining DNA ligase [Streptantibioticus silvisoli]
MPQASGGADRQAVEFEGRRLVLSHLSKVLFPATGLTKAAALDYYARIAPVLLPHTAGRPASFVRAPEGPGGQRWYAKNPPPGMPEWVPVAEIASSEGPAPHVMVDDAATLLAMANLGAWEVHVPQWTVAAGPQAHDRLVLDLDPGPGAGLPECCRIAEALREELAADGLTAQPVVSGSKGMHLYVRLVPAGEEAVRGYARRLAGRLESRHPRRATATMAKAARSGKVFIDWSQNASAKTTAAPYTLRLLDAPRVAAPVTWEEVAGCRDARELWFTPAQVLDRVARGGDPLEVPAEPAALP